MDSLPLIDSFGLYPEHLKPWGRPDSNREPSSYEPPALTVELRPLLFSKKRANLGFV